MQPGGFGGLMQPGGFGGATRPDESGESVRLKPLLSTWKPCGLDAPPSTSLPDFHDLSRGFIPRWIRWSDAARRIRWIDAARRIRRIRWIGAARRPGGTTRPGESGESVRLKPLLSTWKPYGLNAPPHESGLPDFHDLSRGFIPWLAGWLADSVD